jgi:hypothetical protein
MKSKYFKIRGLVPLESANLLHEDALWNLRKMKTVGKKCTNCGSYTAECVKLLGNFWVPMYLCRSCVSKTFRSFLKDK